ncbi:MAG: hypothetical protein ACFFCE_20100 [Promethearchaeota archaeon]
MKGILQRIERRIENFKKNKVDLDKIIEQIEKMENLDKDKVMELIRESIKK